MATTKAKALENPAIQIDDLTRAMTDEEYLTYSEIVAGVTGSNDNK